MKLNRRRFLATSAAFVSSPAIPAAAESMKTKADPGFGISLAQWSMHRALHGGKLDNLDWPAVTKEKFGIDALEWVNQFFSERSDKLGLQPKGGGYVAEMRKRCDDLGMSSLLIMCDGVGQIGDPDDSRRTATVEGHRAWLDAARELGCHSIRVNAGSNPRLPAEEQAKLCVDGLRRLSEHAATLDLNVIVENHGGLSSHGGWLAGVLKSVGLDNCGSLPDFGNFYVVKKRGDAAQYEKQKALFENMDGLKEDAFGLGYDRYEGTRELMPYAKGVSAKSHDFKEDGEEAHTDFAKMMGIVRDSSFRGHIGVEYEGSNLTEADGILATKALLEKVINAA